MPALNELHRQYKDRAAFYIVYIQEAHPVDAWQVSANVKDDVLLASARTRDERAQVAGTCVRDLGIEFTALVDDTDDRVERDYTGWPDRLYVIDYDGRIAYKSAAGPFGFEPEEVGAALKRLIPSADTPEP